MTNWNERPLPRAAGGKPNPNRKNKKKTKSNVSSSSLTPMPSLGTEENTGGIIALESTPEELRQREQRLMRFGTAATTWGQPATNTEDNRGGWTADGKIIGTSRDLEKPYFRLTSAPDPATVRPLEMLKIAYTHVKRKWKTENNYKHACEQLKSIRQDLTVQGIRGRFATTIYEYHARIALEVADLSEYNQCQSQLRELYTEGSESNTNNEFIAYEILYLLFSGNRSEMNSLLERRALAKVQGKAGGKTKSKALRHALAVRAALAVGNYHQFFKLYQDAPNRNALLMDQFIPRERVKALIMLCKSYPMGLPLDFISRELAFYSVDDATQFLEKHGIKVDDVNGRLETKPALPLLHAAIANKYQKADIKGQV
ncbi:SAC3/GANP/Nin1/mts3/eIF-3 p25 family-domain-containing protein [Zychaea mexicana]|uniref:SAC3/GANP/Nin1/mts3/eIF-3 p25 family-domain-containing protein n=1 Tax=Zychaea mexicana TaxID=64656 RepID=UPI0022FE2907|nr:SAC3/GANP/Nin1/mts3/eIF-3 p25 family-domain-containing protein [Zychaea mexicana]KAI9471372.1 SAC3/GANP/Nin1/mts3/eIF-3 p25 family-domain-containing protein [Zychaea mexicana]